MEPAALLDELMGRGFGLRVEGETLWVDPGPQALDATTAERIRVHKPDLLRLVAHRSNSTAHRSPIEDIEDIETLPRESVFYEEPPATSIPWETLATWRWGPEAGQPSPCTDEEERFAIATEGDELIDALYRRFGPLDLVEAEPHPPLISGDRST